VRDVFLYGRPCVLERERSERLPNGLPRWAEIRAYPIQDIEGQVELVMTIGFDVTDKKYGFVDQQKYIDHLERRLKKLVSEKCRITSNESESRLPGLTGREVEVLSLMAEGFSNVEISRILSLSPHTVKSHVNHIFNKLGVNDRTEAAIAAARLKLI
jgi:DNA-binding CsgD family transcriptional regulator